MTTSELRDVTRFSARDKEAHAMLTCLRDALAACDELRGARIARARTSVHVRIVDPVTGESDGPVVVCDRPRPSVSLDGHPAECAVYLTPEQARSYCAGELQLATALVAGEVRATGPARKFLVVEPIVRALIAERPARGTVA